MRPRSTFFRQGLLQRLLDEVDRSIPLAPQNFEVKLLAH